MNIGLVGEAPNDTVSIQNLLEKKYDKEKFIFFSMLDRISGSHLDSQKVKRFLRIEFELKNPDIVVFIRDLDSTSIKGKNMVLRKSYFTSSNSVVNKKGVYLLHIYEIEALILSDIEVFNRIYEVDVSEISNPMLIEEPKEFLKSKSNKYCESDNPGVFEQIRIEKAMTCGYFKLFIKNFDRAISELEKK